MNDFVHYFFVAASNNQIVNIDKIVNYVVLLAKNKERSVDTRHDKFNGLEEGSKGIILHSRSLFQTIDSLA